MPIENGGMYTDLGAILGAATFTEAALKGGKAIGASITGTTAVLYGITAQWSIDAGAVIDDASAVMTADIAALVEMFFDPIICTADMVADVKAVAGIEADVPVVVSFTAGVTGLVGLVADIACPGSETFDIRGGLYGAANLAGDCTVTPTIMGAGVIECSIAIPGLPTAIDIAYAIWGIGSGTIDIPGTAGAKLNQAGSAGDPWGTALPGTYTAGQAGKIVGDYLDATVSSRSQPGDELDQTIDGTDSMQDVLKYVLAFIAGKSSGGGTKSIVLKGADGIKSRLVMTVDANGNRSVVVKDAT
jgi:hypothetical protein